MSGKYTKRQVCAGYAESERSVGARTVYALGCRCVPPAKASGILAAWYNKDTGILSWRMEATIRWPPIQHFPPTLKKGRLMLQTGLLARPQRALVALFGLATLAAASAGAQQRLSVV